MQEVMIPGSLGDIYGTLCLPEAQGPMALVILSHGFSGDHTGHEDYAAFFLSKGFAVYNFDFCGGGLNSRSAGTMLQMSVLTEAEDLNAIIDHFMADGRFEKIFLWGASQGGFVSSYVRHSGPPTWRRWCWNSPPTYSRMTRRPAPAPTAASRRWTP